jgi:hypothetical protein
VEVGFCGFSWSNAYQFAPSALNKPMNQYGIHIVKRSNIGNINLRKNISCKKDIITFLLVFLDQFAVKK